MEKKLPGRFTTIVLVSCFCVIILLNFLLWPSVSQRYYPIQPHFGDAIDDFIATYVHHNDRSWYVYMLLERHFSGWNLISYAKEPALASSMYALPYGGIKNTRILPYDPTLTAEEAAAFIARANVQAKLLRLNGTLSVVLPSGNKNQNVGKRKRKLLVLRYETQHFFVPLSMAPSRYAEMK